MFLSSHVPNFEEEKKQHLTYPSISLQYTAVFDRIRTTKIAHGFFFRCNYVKATPTMQRTLSEV